MKTGLQLSVAALALAGTSLFASVPANADIYGPRGGIGFSYETGGYCDSLGCPEDFWDYPIAYCPVYFAGEWYRGPFYYRYWQGDYYYWIRGDWRRDEWSGDRPDGACVDRFGPAQDYDFYVDNGFIWLDTWRLRFFHHHHHHDHDGDHDHDHDHDHHGDHGHGHWDHGGDHGVVWDHGGDHNPQAGGSSGPPPASGAPTPLGGAEGGGSNSGRGLHEHFRGDESGPHRHEAGAPAPNSDSPGGSGSSGHHFDGGARNAPAPLSSPPPSSPPSPPPPPPPPPAPPSSGDSHHDGGFRGDFGHHTQKP